MSKNEGFSKDQLDLIDKLIDKRACVSRAEARRLVLCMPREKVEERINRVCIHRINLNKDKA